MKTQDTEIMAIIHITETLLQLLPAEKNNPRNIQWDNTLLLAGLGVVYALKLVIQNVSKDFWSLFQ